TELPASRLVGLERPRPAVVVDSMHRRLLPATRAGPPVADCDAELLVAVAQDVCPDLDALPHGALDRIEAAVEDGPDVSDEDPGRALRHAHVLTVPARVGLLNRDRCLTPHRMNKPFARLRRQ